MAAATATGAPRLRVPMECLRVRATRRAARTAASLTPSSKRRPAANKTIARRRRVGARGGRGPASAGLAVRSSRDGTRRPRLAPPAAALRSGDGGLVTGVGGPSGRVGASVRQNDRPPCAYDGEGAHGAACLRSRQRRDGRSGLAPAQGSPGCRRRDSHDRKRGSYRPRQLRNVAAHTRPPDPPRCNCRGTRPRHCRESHRSDPWSPWAEGARSQDTPSPQWLPDGRTGIRARRAFERPSWVARDERTKQCSAIDRRSAFEPRVQDDGLPS